MRYERGIEIEHVKPTYRKLNRTHRDNFARRKSKGNFISNHVQCLHFQVIG